MAVTIASYPVTIAGQNVFAGYSPVNIAFFRNDLAITGTSQGIDNTVVINITTDITTELNIGDFLYLNSEDYDVFAEVMEVEPIYIRINTQWLGAGSTGGYINYKQNWYLELELINPLNELAKVLPFTLRDNGSNEGNVVIDLSIVNDLNRTLIPSYASINEITIQRKKFDIKYREVYREGTTAYTRITNPIIIIPAKEQTTLETFGNSFSEPEYYKGYPNGAVFTHSDTSPIFANNINFYFDQLNINKNIISGNNQLGIIDAGTFGKIFVPLVALDLLSECEYIDLKTSDANIPEFNPLDFTNDFNIA